MQILTQETTRTMHVVTTTKSQRVIKAHLKARARQSLEFCSPKTSSCTYLYLSIYIYISSLVNRIGIPFVRSDKWNKSTNYFSDELKMVHLQLTNLDQDGSTSVVVT